MKPLFKNTLAVAVGAAISFHAQAETASQDKLVIAASKSQATVEDFAGTVSVVTAKDIQLSGASNILEAIDTLPGISASRTGGGRSGISIRGMETNHTLILVDGRRVSDTDTNVPFSDFQLNWVPMGQIERIEVIRGPVSNLYGSAALGGVINIITKKAEGEWITDVSARKGWATSGEGGDEDTLSIAAAGEVTDKVGLSLSLEKRDEDAYRELFAGGDSAATKAGKEIVNATAKVDVELSETDQLGVSVILGSEDRIQFPDTPDYEIDRQQLAVDYRTEVAGFEVTSRIWRSETDNRLPDSSGGYRNRDLTEDVITVDINGELNENNFLTAGVEYATEEYDQKSNPASSSDFRDEFKNASVFLQDRTEITDDVSVTWGARYDDHQRFGSEVSPKLYLNWSVSDNWQIKTGYGEGFKAPAIREASSDYELSYGYPTGPGLFTQNVFRGNSNLKPETSKTVEFGATYSNGALNGGFTLFNNDVENLISTSLVSSDTVGGTTTRTYLYSNVSRAEIRGLEAELSYDFSDALDASFNLTLTDHEDKDTGNWLTNRSQVEANLIVTYEHAPWDMQTRLAWNYQGKQYEDAANTDEAPAVDTIDLTFRKAFTPQLSAQVGVYNLFDKLAAEDDDDGSHTEKGRLVALSLNGTF